MTRAVLSEDTTRDDVDDAALRHGWQLTNVLPAEAARPAQLIFAAGDRRTFLYLVDEPRLGVVYLTASGDRADAVFAAACDALGCDTRLPPSLQTLLDQSEPDEPSLQSIGRGLAIAALSVPAGTHPAGPRLALLQRALAHPDARVRALAVTAAGYARWPRLQPALARVAGEDASPALRHAAAALAGALEAS